MFNFQPAILFASPSLQEMRPKTVIKPEASKLASQDTIQVGTFTTCNIFSLASSKYLHLYWIIRWYIKYYLVDKIQKCSVPIQTDPVHLPVPSLSGTVEVRTWRSTRIYLTISQVSGQKSWAVGTFYQKICSLQLLEQTSRHAAGICNLNFWKSAFLNPELDHNKNFLKYK